MSITREHIRALFRSLQLQFGALWATPDRVKNMPATVDFWWRVLADLHPDDLERGMARLGRSTREFPPTSGQFREMCKLTPGDLGFPDAYRAYRLAALGPARMVLPAIAWHAKQLVGASEVETLPEAVIWPKFRTVYQHLIRTAMELAEEFALDDAQARAEAMARFRAVTEYPQRLVRAKPELAAARLRPALERDRLPAKVTVLDQAHRDARALGAAIRDWRHARWQEGS